LTRAIGPSVNSSYAYDGDGNRITQSTASGTYNYTNDVATALPVVLNEQGPDGNITYAYGLGLIEAFSPSFSHFYHYDGLGSVIALTDAAGKPSAAYAYDPWGNALITVPDSVGTKNKFRFTGEALDPGTQLYYLRSRYNDPATGRLISRDTAPGNILNPLSLHRYIYALSNPIRYTDPTGHDAWDSFFTWCSSFSDRCASVEDSTHKAEEYNNCTQNIENSSNGCNNGFPQSYAKTATMVVDTGVKVTIAVETNPTIYGAPALSTPWWAKTFFFLKDLFTPKTVHAASDNGLSSQLTTSSPRTLSNVPYPLPATATGQALTSPKK
jgi:RHS repeat-associated protein